MQSDDGQMDGLYGLSASASEEASKTLYPPPDDQPLTTWPQLLCAVSRGFLPCLPCLTDAAFHGTKIKH